MKSTSDNTNIAKKLSIFCLLSVTRCKTEKWATFGIFCKILAIFVFWCKNISGNALETGSGFFGSYRRYYMWISQKSCPRIICMILGCEGKSAPSTA